MNSSSATLLTLKVKSQEAEKLSYALWDIPGVQGIEEAPLGGESLFRPEAEFEILEFGSEAAQKCAEWMQKESYRPQGQMLLKIYLSSEKIPSEREARDWIKNIPSKFFFEWVNFESLEEKDYLETYKKSVQGSKLCHDLFVGPPWALSLSKPEDTFYVEPGLAFGTGDHPTTQLCLERIKEYSLEARWSSNFRTLDLGAGTGVLGLAVKRYFPECELTLADYDPLCGNEIEKTFKLNQQSLAGCKVVAGPEGSVEGLMARHAGPFHFIVSNIYAEILTKNVKFIRQLLCPGGLWLLSGILEGEPEDQLTHALQREGFKVELRRSRVREGALWKDSGLESHSETWVLLEAS